MFDIDLSPAALAGTMLFLRDKIPWDGWPTVAGVLELVGAGHSQAYDKKKSAFTILPLLDGKPGRPASPPCGESTRATVLDALYGYLLDNCGAVSGQGERRHYSEGFRRLVVGLRDPGQPAEGVPVAEFADMARVPLGTVKDWLHPQHAITPEVPAQPSEVPPADSTEAGTATVDTAPATPPCAVSPADSDVATVQPDLEAAPSPEAPHLPISDTPRGAHLNLIAKLWKSWKGPFDAFCRMLRQQERLPYSPTFIGDFLQALGLRHRRPHTPVEAPWSSGTLRMFFPGAQWFGDGKTIAVRFGDEIFVFNVELFVDAASDCAPGLHVSDSEDEEAVRLAFARGCEATGRPPLAATLDNRPSNHSPATVEALTEQSILLHATPGRGQSKATVEGSFGLLEQTLPPVILPDGPPRETARTVLQLVLTAYYRGRNGRPRKRLNGRSPAEAYAGARPTPEDIREAVEWFNELQRREQRARQTREARRDPVRRELLKRGLADLEIPDPDQRLEISLAYYGRDAIARGLATFAAKKERGVLPPDADPGRYLGGIIRQLDIRLELEQISIHLMKQRIRLNDFTLAPLQRKADQFRSILPAAALPQAFVDLALGAPCAVDFRFWAQAAAEALSALPPSQTAGLYQPLCRHIAATFKTDRERRADLIDVLAEASVRAA